MSNSRLVSFTQISPNKNSPRNHEIDTITIHCVVGQVSVEELGRQFSKITRMASSNYGIGTDGRIALYVDEADRSWCSSSRANDHRAVTIECASDTTYPYAINDKVYKSLIELCADICKRNGIPKLKWKADKSLIGDVENQNLTVHRWFANTSCPGDYIYSRLSQIADDVNKKLEPATPSSASKYPEVPFTVRVLIDNLNYRVEPDINSKSKGKTGANVFTITKVRNNWGRLKSGAGWIWLGNPTYTEILRTIPMTKVDPYMVRVAIDYLNIRYGPGTDYEKTGSKTGIGSFTIVATSKGKGSETGWGKLKSGAGWIALDYTTRVK